MIHWVPFKYEHIIVLRNRRCIEFLDDVESNCKNLIALENNRYAYSIFEGSPLKPGKIIGCAGLIEYWEGRSEAWIFLDTSTKYILSLHKAVKEFLENCPVARIEATVDLNFKKGHRWVQTLGFKLEAPLRRKYGVEGRDTALYAMVK